MPNPRDISSIINDSKKSKKKIWEEIYCSVKKSIEQGEKESLILQYHYSSQNQEEERDGGFFLKESQFDQFLKNYLHWSEHNEFYEDCSDIKKTITLLSESRIRNQNNSPCGKDCGCKKGCNCGKCPDCC
jgi:hypothetical protein